MKQFTIPTLLFKPPTALIHFWPPLPFLTTIKLLILFKAIHNTNFAVQTIQPHWFTSGHHCYFLTALNLLLILFKALPTLLLFRPPTPLIHFWPALLFLNLLIVFKAIQNTNPAVQKPQAASIQNFYILTTSAISDPRESTNHLHGNSQHQLC